MISCSVGKALGINAIII